MVLKHLQKATKKGISSAEAYERFGILDLPKRISELRQDGWSFRIQPITKKNRFGKKVTFYRYTLEV